ncbi:Crp/Fnr family transcriptional regulator [Mucilaginibacter calamicampi]|uniref:Crp/Fnr family transcriptional regulator n=1 Tax=Mucilaginibacter calamicampi TaxID=1302352 RepID=A0ABW2YT14_9SPHI
MWDLFYQSIQKLGVVLNDDEKAVIQQLFKYRKFRKGQYIVQQDDVVKYETFIISGVTRTYTVDDKGQEHIITFGVEGWWTGDLYSFYTQNATAFNIDCIAATEVLQITQPALDELCLEVPKMNIYYRNLYRNSVIAFSKRMQSTLEKSAPQRYEEFRQNYPLIEQRVANHQIASFLGITPQSLSRIRRLVAKPKS